MTKTHNYNKNDDILNNKVKVLFAMVENSGEGMAIVTPDGCIVYANKAWYKMHGYKYTDKLIGKNLKIFHTKEQLKNQVIPFNKKIIKNGQNVGEVWHMKKNGQIFPTLMTANVIKDDQNNIFLSTTTRDITIRKDFENRLLKSQKDLLDAESIAHLGHWSLDLKSNVLDWSDEVYNIFGITPKKFKNTYEAFLSFVHPEERKYVAKQYKESLKNRTPYHLEHRIIRPDGKERYVVEEAVHEIDSKTKKIVRSIGTVQDITLRRYITKQLKESEERYAVTVEQTGAMIYDYNIATGQIVWSGAIKRITGYSEKYFQRVNIKKWEKMLHPLDNELVTNKLVKAQKMNQMFDVEYKFKTKDGIYVDISDKGKFLYNNSGKAYRMLGMMQDITDKVIAREELKAAYLELLEVDELKSTILRDVSHEFKTPVSIINMTAELLKEETFLKDFKDEKINKYINILIKNSKIFIKELDSILELSRLQSIEKVKKEKIDVSAIAKDIVDEYEQINSKLIDIKCNASKELFVYGNKSLLKRMFANLVDNAYKFTKKGIIEVCVKQRNGGVFFIVKDTGKGVTKHEMIHIFEPFYKVDPSSQGAGVGLAISKKIAFLHGGDISIKSTLGKGSTFIISLPITH